MRNKPEGHFYWTKKERKKLWTRKGGREEIKGRRGDFFQPVEGVIATTGGDGRLDAQPGRSFLSAYKEEKGKKEEEERKLKRF